MSNSTLQQKNGVIKDSKGLPRGICFLQIEVKHLLQTSLFVLFYTNFLAPPERNLRREFLTNMTLQHLKQNSVGSCPAYWHRHQCDKCGVPNSYLTLVMQAHVSVFHSFSSSKVTQIIMIMKSDIRKHGEYYYLNFVLWVWKWAIRKGIACNFQASIVCIKYCLKINQ